MNKIKPEAWIHGTDWQLSEGKKAGVLEEISQRTYKTLLHDIIHKVA